MIPESVLNQIQERVDIVETVSAYVPLKRAGRSFKANCPFHHEKSPSFIVNPDKQIFHCFGCGVGGNVFSFLMKIERKDFREVVEELADRVGVELPKDPKRPVESDAERDLVRANTAAAEYYHRVLMSDPVSEKARAYLDRRGVRKEVLEAFRIGYAPEAWDAFYKHARQAGLAEPLLEKAGLLVKGKNGGWYDRFRARVIFPILDGKGRVVALGGRVLDDSVPKYLNSPETEIYHKGRQLYGLYQARPAIREADAVAVVEGYMDLIACHEAGVKYAVATLGTALTPDQVRLLKRNTHNAYILYDADKAGEAATLRGLELFLEEGMDVRIVRLPEGHDPDSYVRKNGAEGFRAEIAKARSLFEYKLGLLKTSHDPSTLDGKVRIAQEMVGLFAKAKSEILKAAWVKELSQELKLSEQALLTELGRSTAARTARTAEKSAAADGPAEARSAEPAKGLPRQAERLLLSLLLEDDRYVAESRRELRLTDFYHPVARRLVQILWEADERGARQEARGLVTKLQDDPECVKLLTLTTAESETIIDRDRSFTDCVKRLKALRLDGEHRSLRQELAEAQKLGDQNRVNRILYDMNELNKRMKEIHEKKDKR
ncbi:MAG: DNA primase [Candidatus Omnitrophica bacterium]|nr:DNA primase [Candidatus Omnitrophota bacterium]